MLAIGALAFVANIRPVEYLQAIVVFSGTGAAATFVVPLLFAAFWRRATAPGALAAMIAGGATMISLYSLGFYLAWTGFDQLIGPATKFRPYYLLELDPIVWGLLASAVAGITVSLWTSPPDQQRLTRLFDAQTPHPDQPRAEEISSTLPHPGRSSAAPW
jgi:Na+/proline symporter